VWLNGKTEAVVSKMEIYVELHLTTSCTVGSQAFTLSPDWHLGLVTCHRGGHILVVRVCECVRGAFLLVDLGFKDNFTPMAPISARRNRHKLSRASRSYLACAYHET
jgi:hypothetical protein